MRALNQEDEGFDVPLTPLIDVVFLLLIFFLVATTFARNEIDQKVRLPEAEGGTKGEPVSDNLVVNVRRDGTLVVNGRIVDEKGLRTLATEWHGTHPDRRAVIRGDDGAPYGRIMRVMGLCKAVGIVNVDLPVVPLEEAGGTR